MTRTSCSLILFALLAAACSDDSHETSLMDRPPNPCDHVRRSNTVVIGSIVDATEMSERWLPNNYTAISYMEATIVADAVLWSRTDIREATKLVVLAGPASGTSGKADIGARGVFFISESQPRDGYEGFARLHAFYKEDEGRLLHPERDLHPYLEKVSSYEKADLLSMIKAYRDTGDFRECSP